MEFSNDKQNFKISIPIIEWHDLDINLMLYNYAAKSIPSFPRYLHSSPSPKSVAFNSLLASIPT